MLQSEHVVLTALREEDLPAMLEWINDRDEVLYNGAYRPVGPLQHREWFEALQRRTDVSAFAIRLRKSGELIGSCQLYNIHPVFRSAEVKMRLGKVAERDRGYGTEALRLLLRHGFRDLNLHRIYGYPRADNARSIRMLEKAGFVSEGVMRQAAYIDGRYLDLLVCAVLREEFAE